LADLLEVILLIAEWECDAVASWKRYPLAVGFGLTVKQKMEGRQNFGCNPYKKLITRSSGWCKKASFQKMVSYGKPKK